MKANYVPVKGYEEYYGVNRNGEVYSTYTGIVLKHGMSAGYPRVTLYRPGKKPKGVHIHRLLAEHFIENPDSLPYVNHINGDRTDYRLRNLEWVSEQYNVQDGYNRGRVVWNKGKVFVDRTKTCENCKGAFQYKKKHQRFCNNSCAAKAWPTIELFKQGILERAS